MADDKETNRNEMDVEVPSYGKNGIGGGEGAAQKSEPNRDTKITSGKGSYGFKPTA